MAKIFISWDKEKSHLITILVLEKIITFCKDNFFLGLLCFSLGHIKDFASKYINYYNKNVVSTLLNKLLKNLVWVIPIMLAWPNDDDQIQK